ncbi:hypothetical protein Mboo_0425 [Methanoregula boonei 6A8]|jgi:hypothetical protein|uniref:Uncharacterized protein n=1 Tax=Methanoregula boonei (strain DSM 21154 / JCM 14090 / 6A8) TaxID=456442 RepID=A7I5D3_METB6|nr:hypothetical protein Mboo_0425 [Methanoregula boonei 6A8]
MPCALILPKKAGKHESGNAVLIPFHFPNARIPKTRPGRIVSAGTVHCRPLLVLPGILLKKRIVVLCTDEGYPGDCTPGRMCV